MTLTIGSTPIQVLDGSGYKVEVDCVFDKHEGYLVREILFYGNGQDSVTVIGRYGFTEESKGRAQTAYRRAVRYRTKKYGVN